MRTAYGPRAAAVAFGSLRRAAPAFAFATVFLLLRLPLGDDPGWAAALGSALAGTLVYCAPRAALLAQRRHRVRGPGAAALARRLPRPPARLPFDSLGGVRALITGIAGFAGGHLAGVCSQQGATVVGTGLKAEQDADVASRASEYLRCDLLDAAQTTGVHPRGAAGSGLPPRRRGRRSRARGRTRRGTISRNVEIDAQPARGGARARRRRHACWSPARARSTARPSGCRSTRSHPLRRRTPTRSARPRSTCLARLLRRRARPARRAHARLQPRRARAVRRLRGVALRTPDRRGRGGRQRTASSS